MNSGRAPIRKNGSSQSITRGTTPIEKNIIVIDELGNRYEATYPRRAKGLVKNGRARFLSENMICLACPPNSNDLEDHIMTDMNKTETAVHTSTPPKQAPSPVAPSSSVEYSIPYILAQMAAIQGDTAYIHDALNSLTGVISDTETGRDINLGPGAVMADDPRSSAADAVKHIVISRETTNQQLLRMYDKMLTHLTGVSDANVMGRDGKRF